jgi:gamma-glutamylcyclotransferase (GGCT)/AIG2-like uncharacterized protein YtfP
MADQDPETGSHRLKPTPATEAVEITDLFVYGSLIDPARRQRVLGYPSTLIPALLKNYDRREGKYLYLVKAQGHEVHGWVLGDLSKEDFRKLDGYEVVTPTLIQGAMRRLYARELLEVETNDGRVMPCWVYLPNLPDWPARWK